jgi:hypothetical protein
VLAALACLRGVQPLVAQTGEVEGWVRSVAGRAIPAAVVMLSIPPDTMSVRAGETDRLGRFRFQGLEPGAYDVRARSVGFVETSRPVIVSADSVIRLELELQDRPVDLPGVTVEVNRARASFDSEAATTRRGLARDELKLIPGVAEADVLSAVEVLPGVVSTSDYSSAFNVRGGSADQNLILLDGVPIYNPFHLGGLFSVFNSDIVARAELLAGGFPAEYGGRVASVLGVESDATGSGTDVDGGISLLAARLALGTDLPRFISRPLGMRTGRARISLRRSYFDALLKPFVDFPYHLIDGQAYVEGWTAGGRRISLTAYSGRDVLDLARSDNFPLQLRWGWGNDLGGVRYTWPMSGGRTLDARAGFTRFSTDIRFPDFDDTELRSEVRQFIARADLDVPAGDAVRVQAGVEANHLAYDNRVASGGTEFAGGEERGWLAGGYTQASWRAGDWLLEAGARADAWLPRGGDALGVVGPRLGIKRFLNDGDAAIKLAAGRYSQFIHSIRDEELPLGIDVWVLSGERAPHTVSDQIQAGIESFVGGGWFAGVEAYYRWFDGVVTNNFADDPNTNTDDLVAGTGDSYGADVLVRRDHGRVRPTVSVSWLRAWRDFEDPSLGVDTGIVRYPPIFDRRIDVEVLLQALLPGDVQAGLRWNFGSGLPFTRVLGGFRSFTYHLIDRRVDSDTPIDEEIGVVLGPRNAERFPAYHRLDVNFRKTWQKSWGTLTPYLDVVNLYDRRNVLFYFYEFDRSPPVRSGVSMFPFLPTLGVEFSF